MTLATTLAGAYLRELHALTRLRLGIVSHATDGDWAYVLAAIDTRGYHLRELLSRESPELLAALEDLLAVECAEVRTQPVIERQELSADVPPGARVH